MTQSGPRPGTSTRLRSLLRRPASRSGSTIYANEKYSKWNASESRISDLNDRSSSMFATQGIPARLRSSSSSSIASHNLADFGKERAEALSRAWRSPQKPSQRKMSLPKRPSTAMAVLSDADPPSSLYFRRTAKSIGQHQHTDRPSTAHPFNALPHGFNKPLPLRPGSFDSKVKGKQTKANAPTSTDKRYPWSSVSSSAVPSPPSCLSPRTPKIEPSRTSSVLEGGESRDITDDDTIDVSGEPYKAKAGLSKSIDEIPIHFDLCSDGDADDQVNFRISRILEAVDDQPASPMTCRSDTSKLYAASTITYRSRCPISPISDDEAPKTHGSSSFAIIKGQKVSGRYAAKPFPSMRDATPSPTPTWRMDADHGSKKQHDLSGSVTYQDFTHRRNTSVSTLSSQRTFSGRSDMSRNCSPQSSYSSPSPDSTSSSSEVRVNASSMSFSSAQSYATSVSSSTLTSVHQEQSKWEAEIKSLQETIDHYRKALREQRRLVSETDRRNERLVTEVEMLRERSKVKDSRIRQLEMDKLRSRENLEHWMDRASTEERIANLAVDELKRYRERDAALLTHPHGVFDGPAAAKHTATRFGRLLRKKMSTPAFV